MFTKSLHIFVVKWQVSHMASLPFSSGHSDHCILSFNIINQSNKHFLIITKLFRSNDRHNRHILQYYNKIKYF